MEQLDIELLGRQYSVGCPPEERERLLATVDFLSARLAEVQRRTQASGERLAVMTALNLAHELIEQQRGNGIDTVAIKRRIELMKARLDGVLAQQDRLF